MQAEGGDAQHMCRVLEKAIKDDTGYEVVLAVKEHLSFVQQLKLLDVDTKIIVQSPEHLLLKSGNCIPLALAALWVPTLSNRSSQMQDKV